MLVLGPGEAPSGARSERAVSRGLPPGVQRGGRVLFWGSPPGFRCCSSGCSSPGPS
ncbi:hypothetical protein NKG05_15925 [Oerskovia sp. M15]